MPRRRHPAHALVASASALRMPRDRGFPPDGKRLALVTQEGSAFRIAALELASGAITTLSRGALDESPSFAPNGAMLIYAGREGSQGVLATVSVDGQITARLKSREGEVTRARVGPVRELSIMAASVRITDIGAAVKRKHLLVMFAVAVLAAGVVAANRSRKTRRPRRWPVAPAAAVCRPVAASPRWTWAGRGPGRAHWGRTASSPRSGHLFRFRQQRHPQ